jgi:hypothetical protein
MTGAISTSTCNAQSALLSEASSNSILRTSIETVSGIAGCVSVASICQPATNAATRVPTNTMG